MEKLEIYNSMYLNGNILISGSKNASLPIICACLLTDDTVELTNVPKLKDIETLLLLLNGMGVKSYTDGDTLYINASTLSNCLASYDSVKTMRASILVLGPLLSKYSKADVSLPGGCAIGDRPVDQHIKGLVKMGARISIEQGYIRADVDRLKGADITMDVITVTGTENLLMAAVLADGESILRNCAIEPEVTDLANFLVNMGAQIRGIGTNTLIIDGVSKLRGTKYNIMPDRIEAGTYAVTSVATCGDILLSNLRVEHMNVIVDKLIEYGADITVGNGWMRVKGKQTRFPVNIKTNPYPNFPTDMQAQFMVLNCLTDNSISIIEETIFENRFMHVPELCRMGAKIKISGNNAIVTGVRELQGTSVTATDLRASASLVIAGLVAYGKTTINSLHHLDRGYEQLVQKLANVGARVCRVKE